MKRNTRNKRICPIEHFDQKKNNETIWFYIGFICTVLFVLIYGHQAITTTNNVIGAFIRIALLLIVIFAIYIWIIVNQKRMRKLYLIKTHNLISVQPEIDMELQEDSSTFLIVIDSKTITTCHFWYVLEFGGILHREVSTGYNVGIYVIETDTAPKVEVWHNATGYTEYRFMIPRGGSFVIKNDYQDQDDYYWSY